MGDWVRLTEPSGSSVWVNLAQAIKIREEGNATTIYLREGGHWVVKETPPAIMAMPRARGA